MQAMRSCCINVCIAIAFLHKFLIWINKLLMVLDGCLVFINWQLFRSSSKTSHSFCWVQVVGDEWPDRLFTLPKWIMKNMVNLIQLSKNILNSVYGKSIVLYIVAISRDLAYDGHLLFAKQHPFPLYLGVRGLYPLPAILFVWEWLPTQV